MLSWFLHLKIYLWNNTLTMDSEQGPQYVCTNFWTFVCTICSGVQYADISHHICCLLCYFKLIKKFDNWGYLRLHLVIFLFLEIYMLSNFCVWNNSSWEFTHRVNQYQWPTLVQCRKVSALKEGKMGNTLTFIYN